MDPNRPTRWAKALAFAAIGALVADTALAKPKKPAAPRLRPAIHAGNEVAKTSAKKPAARIVRNVPLPRPRPHASGGLSAYAQANVGLRGALFASRALFKPLARPVSGPFAVAPSAATSPDDIAAVRRVIEDARKGKDADANETEKSITDPVARKLAEWVILRSDNTNPPFARYAAFVNANPSWPHAPLFRRRAENALWNDRLDDATVLAFFANHKPTTAKGHYMLAHALLAKGDRAGAAALVRYAWRNEDCSADVESKVLEMFGDLLTRADHKARMEQRFYADDIEAGMRAAQRLGGDELAIGRARTAVIKRLNNAKALLDAVPAAARNDPGYIFARVQWLRKQNKAEEAGRLILTVPQDPEALVDLNQWWVERRLLVRKLLDDGDAKTAYRVARDAASPPQDNYRVDQHFTAGWIALRYSARPEDRRRPFRRHPARHGQPARARPRRLLAGARRRGHGPPRASQGLLRNGGAIYRDLLRPIGARPARPHRSRSARTALVHAAGTARARAIWKSCARRKSSTRSTSATCWPRSSPKSARAAPIVAGMATLAELAGRHDDGRSMLLLGQGAYGRGLPLDFYAYPTVGLPDYRPIAPPIEPAVAYSIARQESHFNQKIVSSAHAMGLMQVTPEAAQDTAKHFKATYNRARLLSDPVYNMQMGAAELSNLLHGYNGSYILTFAGYNAGRGRVRQWIAAYGDPRDPKVDPVDWVERIPIAETRNYVERIMENLQVYRARFGGSNRLMIEADLRRGAGAN